jgi:hypothetical protein
MQSREAGEGGRLSGGEPRALQLHDAGMEGEERMAVTYLCGGINGLGDADCRDWREVAKSLLKTETLDPMRRDYRGREAEAVREIVEGDLEDIAQSDYVLVNATRPSWGTAMEIVYAAQCGKTVVAFTGGAPISPWLRYHTGHLRQESTALLCNTAEDACACINALVRG